MLPGSGLAATGAPTAATAATMTVIVRMGRRRIGHSPLIAVRRNGHVPPHPARPGQVRARKASTYTAAAREDTDKISKMAGTKMGHRRRGTDITAS